MSFSAEMKDFLNAYKTGQSINASRTDQEYKDVMTDAARKKTERDNDPETLALQTEQAKATLANTKDRMSNSASARGLTGARTALVNEQLKQIREGAVGGSGLYPAGAINPTAPTGNVAQPTPQGALPIGGSTLDTGEDAYAEGGLVPDPEDELDDPDGTAPVAPAAPALNTDMSAQPSPAPAVGGGPQADTDFSAARRNPNAPPRGLEGIISPALVEDARLNGMKFGIEKAGLHQTGAIRSASQMLKAKQIAAGMGGLSEAEMRAAKQAVDPEGKLTDSQRNIAALGSVYQFWANKGEPEKAQRVAFQMLQYYRGASQRYAAIAAKAAEGGNMDLATKAAVKAYANVPDGKDLEITPNPDGGLMYNYTDQNGDVISKGIATPQQLVASAMGLATGGFDKALLSAAGATADTGAVKTSGGKPQSAGDRAKETENITGEVEKMKAAWQDKNKGTPLDEEQWNEVGNAAQHIYQQNPHATPNEAARAAHAMLSMGDDPEKPGFKIKPGEDGKASTVDFGGKLKVQLDDAQLDSILNARAVRVKAANDALDKKMEDGDKPGFIDKAAKAGSNIGGILAHDVSDIGQRVSDATPEEFKARAGSAVSAAGRATHDVLGALLDPSINVGTLSTAFKDKTRAAAQALIDKLSSSKSDEKGAIPVDEESPSK